MIGVDDTQTSRVVRASRVEKETGDGEISSGLVHKLNGTLISGNQSAVTLLQANYRQG
jgi:hypothetical protein